MTERPANVDRIVEHVFRHEYGKLTATLARAFGLDRLGVVEDIVQDALLTALNTWSFHEVPKDPTAWLHRVARNRALDHLRHERNIAKHEGPVGEWLEANAKEGNSPPSESEIQDSQLQMIFACCHPGISTESQIALTLKTLCGFSVAEIASAFITNEATIEKRLQRARKYFRENRTKLEPPTSVALHARISTVLTSLYLLFTEGYKRSHSDGLLEKDLCLEALRLALLVSDAFGEAYPEANALVALMLFHASRFDARISNDGGIVLLSEQDRSSWNKELIARGHEYFARSEPESLKTYFHIEAAIQALHCIAPSFEQTDWASILGLYKRLYALKPNPIVLLHMSVSVCQVFGPDEALALLEGLPLADYYLYHALRGDLLLQSGRKVDAMTELQLAYELSNNTQERTLLKAKLARSSDS